MIDLGEAMGLNEEQTATFKRAIILAKEAQHHKTWALAVEAVKRGVSGRIPAVPFGTIVDPEKLVYAQQAAAYVMDVCRTLPCPPLETTEEVG